MKVSTIESFVHEKKEKFYESSHFAELFTQSLVCYECMSHQNCFSDDDNYFGAIIDCNEDSNACYSMKSGTNHNSEF